MVDGPNSNSRVKLVASDNCDVILLRTGEETGEGRIVQEAPENQEPVVMSLDEYMKQKEKSKAELPVRQMRKAGEGEGSFHGSKLGKKIQKKDDSDVDIYIFSII